MEYVLLLFALVIASFAVGLDLDESEEKWDQDQFEDLDLDELEKELRNSPMIDIDTGPYKRGAISSIFAKSCSCENNSCMCCSNPAIFGFEINGCLKFTPETKSKKITVDVIFKGKILFTRSISITTGSFKYCGEMPGQIFDPCLKIVVSKKGKDGTICGELDINVKGTTVISLGFRCIELKNGKITFSEVYLPPANGVVEIKARRGYKKILDYLR